MQIEFKLVKRFKYITYYTIQYGDSLHSEFQKFQNKFLKDQRLERAYLRLINFVVRIADEDDIEDIKTFFKQENTASRFYETGFIEIEDQKGMGLRLYCYPISNEIVVIFNGCEKTALKAQECPNCSMHFYNANIVSRKIIGALASKQIAISEDKYYLEIEEDFSL